jgi:hypothetical protein
MAFRSSFHPFIAQHEQGMVSFPGQSKNVTPMFAGRGLINRGRFFATQRKPENP